LSELGSEADAVWSLLEAADKSMYIRKDDRKSIPRLGPTLKWLTQDQEARFWNICGQHGTLYVPQVGTHPPCTSKGNLKLPLNPGG
jgi:hypothetical protein